MYIISPDTNQYVLDKSNLKELMSISWLNKENKKETERYLRSLYKSLKLNYHYDEYEIVVKTLNGIDLSVEGSSLKDKISKINKLNTKFSFETYEYAKGNNMFVEEEYERLHKVNVMVLADEELIDLFQEIPNIEQINVEEIMLKLRKKYNNVNEHYGVYLTTEGEIEGGKIDVVFYESKLNNLNRVFKDDVLLIQIPKDL